MTIDTSELDNIIAAGQKNYQSAFRAGSAVPKVNKIPFHSHELNIATGGGIPAGRISRLWGHAGAGKSLTSLLLARNAQNLHIIAQQYLDNPDDQVKAKAEKLLELFPEGLKVCWYDAEQSFDPDFAAALGVNIDELLVLDDRRIEVIGGTLEAALGAAHLHIIDSTAGGVSIDELKEGVEKWQRGLKARVWNKVVDRFQAAMDRESNWIVFIDQVRINQTTGAYQIPGGEKMRHESSLTVQFKKQRDLWKKNGEWTEQYPQKETSTLSKTPEAQGMDISAVVEKNRVGSRGRKATLRYDFKNKVFETDRELANIAEFIGVAEKSGSWYKLPDESTVQGVNQLTKAINDQPELKKQILDAIESYIINNP